MATDLDTFTVPANPNESGHEVFDPINAWVGAPSRIVVAVHRVGPVANAMLGYDPVTGRAWTRQLKEPGLAWTPWRTEGDGGEPDNLSPPVALGASMVNGETSVLVHFSLALDPASVPPPAAFTVMVKGDAKPIVAVRISVSDIALDMDARHASGPILLSYAPGTPPLRSIDGVDVQPFADFSVQV